MLASWEIYLLFFAYFIHWNISACVCPSTFWHFRQQFRRINVGFSYTDLRQHFKIFSAFRINPKNNNLWSLAWTPSPPTFCGYVGGKLQAAHCYYSQVHGSPLMKGLRDLWDPEGPAHLFHCTKSSTGIRWSLFRREDQWIFVSCCPYMYCMPCFWEKIYSGLVWLVTEEPLGQTQGCGYFYIIVRYQLSVHRQLFYFQTNVDRGGGVADGLHLRRNLMWQLWGWGGEEGGEQAEQHQGRRHRDQAEWHQRGKRGEV